MSLNKTGALLEGIRVSRGNNGFSFPPRNLVPPDRFVQFNSQTTRKEYGLFVSTNNPLKSNFEIADPDLKFDWNKNESNILRFDYDGFSDRWLPLPGSSPDLIGKIQNEPRLIISVPDPSVTDAPYDLYVGSPIRQKTFFLSVVSNESLFTDPSLLASGNAEVSEADGKLNFSDLDIADLENQVVYYQRQSFFDRTKETGRIGELPSSSSIDYNLFLNPRPSSGQTPLIRIEYQNFLTAIEVANESLLGSPLQGTFTWSADTGKIRLSDSDVEANPNSGVYYSGIAQNSVSFNRISHGSNAGFFIPDSVGETDTNRFIIFAESLNAPRVYWSVIFSNSDPTNVANGTVVINNTTGQVWFSARDASNFSGYTYYHLDSRVEIENGVFVQFYRSGVNGSGVAVSPDFWLKYFVEEQIVVDGLQSFPFIVLPTIPIEDDSLVYDIGQGSGSSGTFTGQLVDARDPDSLGFGYLPNFDQKQLRFTDRKQYDITVEIETSSIKLQDAAVNPIGIIVTQDGQSLTPDVDFTFNESAGLLEFTDPVGVNDPNGANSVNGSVVSTNTLVSEDDLFDGEDVGKYILIESGPNTGAYRIDRVVNSKEVVVESDFLFSQIIPVVFNFVTSGDVIIDRFFTRIFPPYKNITITVQPQNGDPRELSRFEYTVFQEKGQVNIPVTKPGDVYTINYVSRQSSDGVNFTDVNVTEKALFIVRLDPGQTTTGSNIVNFNPSGRQVSTDRDFDIALNGVPLQPDQYNFIPPNQLELFGPPCDDSSVSITYWVEEAKGGEYTFDVQSPPMSVDTPEIFLGERIAEFNGDQTSIMEPGSPVLYDDTYLLIVENVEYDSEIDKTEVTFTTTPEVDSAGSIIQSSRSLLPLLVSESITLSETWVQNSSSFRIIGNQTSNYRLGIIVIIDTDPFYVLASEYDAETDTTEVTVSANATKNYISPNIQRTTRPTLSPTTNLSTNLSANTALPFKLFRMTKNEGDSNELLVEGIDYSLGAGGSITLFEEGVYDEAYLAFYVANRSIPSGTVYNVNYSYAIAPDENNGIQGQRLISTYNLYAPDTFFYRVETIDTFLPEVNDFIRGASASTGSGPRTGDASGQANKDKGNPSPYFREQNLGNIDEVISRLLKYYNDFINYYEDILANLDGRVVGGPDGRFRFDGFKGNPPRNSYSEITNDIDDTILLYDILKLTGFYTFDNVPVFSTMAQPNALSRIFPTSILKLAALNDQVGTSNNGSTIGSFEISDITQVGPIRSARAISRFEFVKNLIFTETDPITNLPTTIRKSVIRLEENGNPDLLIPEVVSGMRVFIYEDNGLLNSTANIENITNDEAQLDIEIFLPEGGLAQDNSDPENSTNSVYIPGRDLTVNNENGQIVNSTFSSDPNIQTPIKGNEVIQSQINFLNSDLNPRRIPSLDGSILEDGGTPPFPPSLYQFETKFLENEVISYNNRIATCDTFSGTNSLTVVNPSGIIGIGTVLIFTDGLNRGRVRTVEQVLPDSVFVVDTEIVTDTSTSFYVFLPNVPDAFTQINSQLNLLRNNVFTVPVHGSVIGTINSQIISALNIIRCSGDFAGNGNGVIQTNVSSGELELFDPGANFFESLEVGDFIFVSNQPSSGFFKISNILSSDTLTVETGEPWYDFPSSGNASYELYNRYKFIDELNFSFIANFYKETLKYVELTDMFLSGFTQSDITDRISNINERINQVTKYISEIDSNLADTGIYETRYLWIKTRTQRKDGTLARQMLAMRDRQDELQKIKEDQQKLLVTGQI